MTERRALALGLCMALAACGDNLRPSVFDDPTQELPATLAELGIAWGEPAPAPWFAFAPSWPLWSSGSAKDRLAFVPAPIDTTVADAWQFPIGTLFAKTFSYPLAGARQPVETRILRRTGDGWTYDVYLWAGDGSGATKIALDTSVVVELADDGGAPFTHRVPGRLDCRTCHESAAVPALGFSEIQLDAALLAALDAEGLRSVPSATPARIEHADPATRDVLGLFQGNCVHCHNGGAGVSASFDLRHGVALAAIIDQPTASSASAAGIRVVPGSPGTSILFLAVSGETADPAVKPMPPLGIDRRDAGAIERLRAWIAALPATN